MGFVADMVGLVLGNEASRKAGHTQADSAREASAVQQQQYNQFLQNQQPYMNLGTSTIPQLQQYLGSNGLTNQFSFNPTQEQLEQTPGYQFTLNQGLKGLMNVNSGRGLNLSGAEQKGMADYTTGLANQTYQNQYNNALNAFRTNYGVNNDMYSRLSGLVGLGQNAATGVGNAGMQTASNIGNNLIGAGNANAAGIVGGANAISTGLSNINKRMGLYSSLNDKDGTAGNPIDKMIMGAIFG